MRTPLACTLRVTISPWNSLPAFLKEPMVVMSFLLGCSNPRPSRPRWRSTGRRRSTPHPLGRSAAEDGGGGTFLAREEWAPPGSPRLRGGKPRGRKSRRRYCGKAIEACRPVARSRHQEAARVACQTAFQGEDVAGMGPCKRPGFTGEGTETLAYGQAARAIRDRAQRSPPRHRVCWLRIAVPL